MADRIVVMKDGIVQQVAAPREVYANPVNAFVAGFIGSPQMNFFDVDVQRRDDGIFAHRLGAVLPLSAARLNGVRGAAMLGIRPEDVFLSSRGAAHAIPVVVDVIETLGAEQYVFLKLQDGAQLVARVAADFHVRAGQTLSASFAPERIHLFERESGKRLDIPAAPIAS